MSLSVTKLLRARFVFRTKASPETVVTGDEAQATMGRRERRGEARVLPSRLHLRANFHRERDRETSGHEAGHEVFRAMQTLVIT